jgi:hypothetical protein
LKRETVFLPRSGETLPVLIPEGVDGDMFDAIVDHLHATESEDVREQNKAMRAILTEVVQPGDGSNSIPWGGVDITDQWRLMAEHVTPLLEKFRPPAGGRAERGEAPIPGGVEGRVRRKPLPRQGRPGLSGASGAGGTD